MDKPKCLEDIDEESLTLVDVTCPICLSIMIRPVTMPCHHSLCFSCFDLNVTQSKIACPLCRKRISIWVRKMNKCKKLINEDLWQKIQKKFHNEVVAVLNGKDDENNSFASTLPPRKVAAPGEIKEEFEEQARRLREELESDRQGEEAASAPIIQALQEKEEELIQEREQLEEKDFEFAKQLRSSQINESLSVLKSNKNKGGITKNFKKSTSGSTSSSPSAAPINFYLKHRTPEAKIILSPITSPSLHQKRINGNHTTPSLKYNGREPAGDVQVSQLQAVTSTPRNEGVASTSSRLFKDITSHYSSESEPEFDSEENIVSIKNFSSLPLSKAKKKCEWENNDSPISSAKSDVISSKNHEDEADISSLSFISDAFDENNHSTNKYLLKLIEEQKILEQKIEQEKEDRRLALQLQKSFREVDRSKGSEDEYSLRNQNGRTKKPSSESPHSKPTTNISKKNKLRQTTLMESLSKKQRRV